MELEELRFEADYWVQVLNSITTINDNIEKMSEAIMDSMIPLVELMPYALAAASKGDGTLGSKLNYSVDKIKETQAGLEIIVKELAPLAELVHGRVQYLKTKKAEL